MNEKEFAIGVHPAEAMAAKAENERQKKLEEVQIALNIQQAAMYKEQALFFSRQQKAIDEQTKHSRSIKNSTNVMALSTFVYALVAMLMLFYQCNPIKP
jgi:hypothetical protein